MGCMPLPRDGIVGTTRKYKEAIGRVALGIMMNGHKNLCALVRARPEEKCSRISRHLKMIARL